jgi:AraC-like DNA-binding protein
MSDPSLPTPVAVVDLLRRAYRRGASIASVCTGAFVLAEAGLLDGLRATTHWDDSADLAPCYPAIQVDPGVLFVHSGGRVLTPPGSPPGWTCASTWSPPTTAPRAAATARRVVVPMNRDGGQAQFIVHELPAGAASALDTTLSWMRAISANPFTLDDIAGHASMSIRTLNRRFREHVGTTPCSGCSFSELSAPSNCWRPPTCPSSASPTKSASDQLSPSGIISTGECGSRPTATGPHFDHQEPRSTQLTRRLVRPSRLSDRFHRNPKKTSGTGGGTGRARSRCHH